MRNEVADSHFTALQCIFSGHLTRCPLLIRFKHKGTSLPKSKYTIRDYVYCLRSKTRNTVLQLYLIIKIRNCCSDIGNLLVNPA